MIPALTAELEQRGLPTSGPVATRAEFLMSPGLNFAPGEAVERAIRYCEDVTVPGVCRGGGW